MSALLSVKEVAERLGVSTRTARRLVNQMNPVPIGTGERKLLKVAPIDLENWIQRQRDERRWQSGDRAHVALESSDAPLIRPTRAPRARPHTARADAPPAPSGRKKR